ncbi:MAG: ABC transporter substrate-binding protein, partial [Candidatus Helarchaeota archaeon]
GTLDVAYLGLAPAMAHKLTQNAPIKVISGVNVNGSAIVISSSSSINNISDLLNKKIAVPSLNNMQDFILQIALTNAGLTTDNLTRVTMSVGNMETALYTGDIDGFIAWEPFNAKAIDNLGAKILLNSSEVWPNHPCCVIAATNSLIIDKPSIAEKIVKVHKRALEWISNPNNHNEIVQIAKKYTGITSDNTIEMALANIGYVYNFTSYMTEIEKFYDNLTVLNDNIPAWPSGREAFFTEFFNSEFLDA